MGLMYFWAVEAKPARAAPASVTEGLFLTFVYTLELEMKKK
jgi:hypothetical protein